MQRTFLSALMVMLATTALHAAEPTVTHFRNAEGKEIGTATLTDGPKGGMLIDLDVTLPEGTYAIHIHDVGVCEGPAFTSCGSHLNPHKLQHGFLNPKGPHAGDLPNITVGKEGRLKQHIVTPYVSLKSGPYSLTTGDGAAFIIHAGADDYLTDPTGGAGARMACAVIQAEVKKEAAK